MKAIVRDIRPALHGHKMDDGAILARFEPRVGSYAVTYRNRWGETVTVAGLRRIEACTECSKLRSRGYAARIKEMA
jgi:hypothetical protein